MNDTIAAISTSLGIGAISIIRVSGTEALEIVNKIFSGKDLKKVKSHTIHYGYIVDKDEKIDEVLVTVLLSPKTFTRENVVEINAHGGIATTNKILELLLLNGCRLAEPGEFTKRAFLNGRIDLTQAEGVMNLINSKTEKMMKMSLNQVRGNVSNLVKDLRQKILEVLANIEVNIDYPEYEDIEQVTTKHLQELLYSIKEKLTKILDESKNGRILKEGITASIVGKPNVGKSSLLNKLLEYDKAIVTDIEGTTRDCVEGTLNINGVLFNFIDTAGIRQTDDVVEKIGVNKSLELIKNSKVVIYLLNNNEVLTENELETIKSLDKKNSIIIVNKMDLPTKIDFNQLPDNVIKMSVLNDEGINKLKERLKTLFNLERIETEDMTYLTSSRSLAIIRQCLDKIEEIQKGIDDNIPVDIIEIDIKEIWNLLGKIIGETYEDELIDQLFSQFCLGK